MNHRLKKIRKVTMIIALVIIINLGISGCGGRYYRGDYPELFTVALNSLLGASGVAPNLIDDPEIIVLEKDSYGRTLFMYDEGGWFGVSILISQKSDGNYVYFYPHYNFIIFEAFSEMTSRIARNGLRKEHLYPEIIAQINELKQKNDWNYELDLERSTRREIEVYYNFDRKGPVRDEVLLELYNIALGDDAWENPLRFYVNFLTTDDYGRSVYLGTGGEWDNQRHVVMFFQPDGYFDEEKGVMELKDMFGYQTALREFKELNDWNQPFEGSSGIPLWWIITGGVIVGAGGFVAIWLYLRRRRREGSEVGLCSERIEGIERGSTALRSRAIYALEGGMRRILSLYPLGSGKKKVFSLLYIILPSVLVNGLFFLHVFLLSSLPSWYFIAFLYLVTVIGVALFFKHKPCEFNVLILGFALSPVVLFVYAVVIIFGAFPFSLWILPFFASLMVAPTLLYALPFIGISLLLKSRLQK